MKKIKILKHQHWHILLLTLFLYGLYFVVQSEATVLSGELWGVKTLNWYVLAISIPIIHQWYVLFCWRSELHYKSLSNRFGKKGFKLYKAEFEI
ncbi:hypothetical protein ACSTS3_21230 [Aquimarina muelleri]|uniref:hypothetical protein n=1 Tax=Aquimarina muelleri TaxID=279356 RepID=UPI003F685653